MLDNEISTVLTVEEKNSKIYRAGGLELPVERRLGHTLKGSLGCMQKGDPFYSALLIVLSSTLSEYLYDLLFHRLYASRSNLLIGYFATIQNLGIYSHQASAKNNNVSTANYSIIVVNNFFEHQRHEFSFLIIIFYIFLLDLVNSDSAFHFLYELKLIVSGKLIFELILAELWLFKF